MLVGVFLLKILRYQPIACLPHACGGVSIWCTAPSSRAASSPCLWGCFRFRSDRTGSSFVFPMLVGVFLAILPLLILPIGLPHACGGVSVFERFRNGGKLSSPCLWGCFFIFASQSKTGHVFPMLVGVFLRLPDLLSMPLGLPHACGGVSNSDCSGTKYQKSSPCLWGCFCSISSSSFSSRVFPMLVGVFPIDCIKQSCHLCLPHACGGVSQILADLGEGKASSPCLWGCFWWWWHGLGLVRVFPMLVGVFLRCGRSPTRSNSLPHACGGVSQRTSVAFKVFSSSPCSWGCFPVKDRALVIGAVFPMLVGVFPEETLKKLHKHISQIFWSRCIRSYSQWNVHCHGAMSIDGISYSWKAL